MREKNKNSKGKGTQNCKYVVNVGSQNVIVDQHTSYS